jgi:hypothetical protein
VAFACDLVRHADHLEVRYRIENTGKDEIAVLNQIGRWGIGAAYEYSANDVYVDLDGAVVQLTKGALSVPPGASPRDPPYARPDGRMVASGAWIEETVAVPIPVKVRNPYRRDTSPGRAIAMKKAVARVVVVSVGVVPPGSGTVFSRNHPAYPHVVSVVRLTAEPVERWQTLLSKRFELEEDLPVLDYEIFP